MRLAYFLSAVLLAATAVAQGTTSTDKDLTPTDVLAQLPDFPKHWNQAHLYNQVIRDEYGNSAPAGCVPVAGAACMEWFGFPDAFGALAFPGVKRELRTETLDWARLKPVPLDARGRRTAQTILYNLGLYGQIYYVSGGSSTMPLQYLAAVLTSPEVGYASAYFVEFGSNATDVEVETTIWASLRCGSPVAMSVSRDGGAHAVVATGCGTNAAGEPLTQVFGGYGSAPTWMDVPTQMKVPGGYTYNKLASVVTGIVAKRPEGVDSGLALPILGTVKDTAGKPVPFAKVTLSIDGKVVGETATDFEGRYGLWGWFGHDMTVSCGETTKDIPKQNFPGSLDWDTNNLLGTGNWEVSASALASAIEKATVDFTTFPAATYPTIHTSLTDAKADAADKKQNILCLNSEDPDLKETFRKATGYTLLYADPRLPAPFPEVESLPDVRLFRLDASGAITDYSTTATSDKFTGSLGENLITHNLKDSENIIDPSWNADNAHVAKTSDATVTGDVRIATLSVGRPITFTGEGTITWANLEQNDAITLDGPNFRYAPPMVGEGKEAGKTSAFLGDFTVQNGAELYFGAGDVSGYEEFSGTITIGLGGILCVASRDTLNRPLDLAGGEVHLGDKGGNFGSLDLFSTTIKVTADSSISGLSGANNPQLMARNGETTLSFYDGARLAVTVPINTDGSSSLIIRGAYNKGPGTVALNTVSVPTTVKTGVLLEGGTFTGGLTLESGARLTTRAPITVTGDFSANGTITIEDAISGLIVKGVTKIPEGVTFTPPSPNFSVVAAEDGLRLVAKFATAPVWYANGVRVKGKPTDAAPDNSLLVLTTTDRKESGLWEDYAAFRSSPAGGNWNVCIAADGNITSDQSVVGYIQQSAGCAYVLIGASASEIPALAGTVDRLDDHHIGRLPLRDSVQMGTIVDLSKSGGSQVMQDVSTYASLQGYVDKLTRAGTYHAQGRVTLHGKNFGTRLEPYTNTNTYDPALGQWNILNKSGTTFYALCDRYGSLKQDAPNAFPSPLLYCDGTTRKDGGSSPGRPDLYEETAGASLLWVEGAESRAELGLVTVGGGRNQVTADCLSALYTLTLAPVGKSGDLSQKDSPSVGEMLVLNPQGGALAAILPTGSYTPTIGTDGIPSGAEHTLCGAVAEALIKAPTLTVGQAFNQAIEANPDLTTTLTLLGDPTVRIAPFIIPTEWTGEAGDSLWETAGNWRSGQTPTDSDTVTVTLVDGDHASILLPEDATATTLNIVGPESGSATLLLTGTTTDSEGAAIGDLTLTDNLVLTGNVTVETAIPIAPAVVTLGAGATLRTTAELDFTENDINNYWRVSGDGTLDIAHLKPKFTQLPKTLRLTAQTAGSITFSTQTMTELPDGFTVDAGTAWDATWDFDAESNTLTVTLTEAAGQPMPNPILPEGEEGVQFSEETLQALRDAARDGDISGNFHVAAQTVGGAVRPIAELDDALACFVGLTPTVKDGKVVVAYDFGVTRLHIEGDTVFVTLAVRGKGQTLTFAEGNAYAIAPQSLEGSQPLAAPETVTPTRDEDGTVTLSFSLPEGDATFLFRATVSRPTTP